MPDAAGHPDATVASTAGRHSALDALLPHILGTFKREPALALTVAYLMVALAGIYYDYNFYQRFGIPVLSLAQIGDYLVAGLQKPAAIALVVATLPGCWLVDRGNGFIRRREYARRERLLALLRRYWWQRLYLRYLDWHLGHLWGLYIAYVLVIFLYGWFFVRSYAIYNAVMIKRGEVTQVAVRLAGANVDLPASHADTWGYLGAVSNYVFLYDRDDRQPLILPVNAIASLRPPAATEPATNWGPNWGPVAPKP